MRRRQFLQSVSAAAAGLSAPALARALMRAENRAAAVPAKSYPPITGPFRLGIDWHRSTTARFQKQLAEKNLRAAVVSDRHNVNYLTGAFAVTTERPFWLVVPATGEPAVFHPGLDRDLWGTWWIRDRQWYFDYPHHGDFNKVVWEAGATTDLFQWMVDGLAQRSLVPGRLGFDSRPTDENLGALKKAGAEADWDTVGKLLLHMRMVKTPEEIALDRVAMAVHDRMMDFARDYILTHGTDATDFEVAHATEAFGASELFKYLKVNGRPHTGVGVDLGFECRTGPATAYPHPNQSFYKRIERGDALQIAAGVRVGGYGGEGYRAMQIIGPTNSSDDLRRRMWDVHTAMTREQQKLSKAGTPCNQVGAGMLKLAREAGLEKYVYHRPAHGEGSEGHQAPYLSLGDTTVLEENMTFSNEPGLYNPEGGFGYNHSNLVRVTASGGEQINQTPLTREWCWIKI
jgi:Xaa-Pro aminopeptidase